MRKALKYRLYPTKKQEKQLFWTLTHCRELYNAALAERKEAYRMASKSISYYEQKRDLVEIKAILRPEYQDIHSQVLQDVLLRLKRAFDNSFRRKALGENPGYPRFQGRNRYNSFTYPQGGYSLTHDNRVCLSKIGSIKITLHRKAELDRDTNAAINILRVGRTQRGATCVEAPCLETWGTSPV